MNWIVIYFGLNLRNLNLYFFGSIFNKIFFISNLYKEVEALNIHCFNKLFIKDICIIIWACSLDFSFKYLF